MPNYSLVENLDWLRENKQLFIETLDSKLDSPSGLTIHASWDDIVTYINNLPTYIMDLVDGAIEELERFLGNNIEKTIQVTSNKIVPYAFKEKSSIKNFIGNNVTTIGDYAFQNCTNLESFKGTSVTSVGQYAFHNTKIKTISDMPNMTTISDYAFQNCNELTSLNLSNITSVGSYAFYRNSGTSKLVDLVFGANTVIGNYAFDGQNKLNSTLCLSCKSVGSYAFESCASLREIIVTTNVTTMNQNALRNIGSVERILCEATSKPSGWNSSWNYNGYQVYWNCLERDWVFKYNSQQEDTTFHGRIIDVLPTPDPKEGYEFAGWYTDNTLITKVTTPFALPNGNYPVLYAKWLIEVNIITYNTDTSEWYNYGKYYLSTLADLQNLKLGITIDNMYLDSEFTIPLVDDSQLTSKCNVYIVGQTYVSYDLEYTGAVQQLLLPSGNYRLECWGAEGGKGCNGTDASSLAGTPGKGGYSTEVIHLDSPSVIYAYVGGKGSDVSRNTAGAAGFNGGGEGKIGSGSGSISGGGGGASDIRIGTDSLYARVIVAGGGGSTSWSDQSAGVGGGTSGTDGGYSGVTQGCGGTQVAGGSGAFNGSFGQGAVSAYTTSFNAGGAGGGGWYGGGSAGSGASGSTGCGGGGSGWVYSEAAYNHWVNNSTEGQSGGWLLTNINFATSYLTQDGNQSFLSPTGELETGHAGNGYIRIETI